MRKILGYILLLISVISLFGCNKSSEEPSPVIEDLFEQYLNENGNFSLSQIDDKLNKEFIDKLPSVIISNKKFNNHMITCESQDDNSDYKEFGKVYSWQEQSNVYISSCSTNNEVISSFYFNLEDLESLYSRNKSYFSIFLEDDTMSNLIDRSLYTLITSLELENDFDLGFEIKLSSILSLITFEYDDFAKVDDVYQLNLDTIIDKIIEFTDNQIQKEDILSYLEHYNADINILVEFDGQNITNINLLGSISMEGISASVTLDLSLEYYENKLSGLKLYIISPVLNGNVSLSLSNDEVKFISDLKTKDRNFVEENYYEILLNGNSIKFLVKQNGLEQVNANLELHVNDNISLTGDIVLLSGSYTNKGSICYRYSKFSFISNMEINIPQTCLNEKNNARNLLSNLV